MVSHDISYLSMSGARPITLLEQPDYDKKSSHGRHGPHGSHGPHGIRYDPQEDRNDRKSVVEKKRLDLA